MSWRDTLAASLGTPRLDADEPKTLSQTPMDKLDNMDTIKAGSNSVHIVHSVHSVPGFTFCGGSSEGIHALGPAECQEVHSWPTPTQRVFVALMGHFENLGYKLPLAEPLAWATVKALMERHGGPVGFRCSAGSRTLPGEVVPLVDMVKSVFGPDIRVSWEA